MHLNGRPLFDYTLRALHSSRVERIFILTEPGEHIDESASPNPKNVYIERNISNGISSNILYAIKEVIRYYSEPNYRNITIIFVPCDLPFVTARNFNSIIENNSLKNATIGVPLIRTGTLKEKYPSKVFWSIYFDDLGDNYSPQSIITLNCSRLEIHDSVSEYPDLLISSRRFNESSREMLVINEAFRTRKRLFNKLYVVILALFFSAARKSLIKGISLNIRSWAKKVTTTEISQYLEEITGLCISLVVIDEAELSFDVDSIEHLKQAENYLRK